MGQRTAWALKAIGCAKCGLVRTYRASFAEPALQEPCKGCGFSAYVEDMGWVAMDIVEDDPRSGQVVQVPLSAIRVVGGGGAATVSPSYGIWEAHPNLLGYATAAILAPIYASIASPPYVSTTKRGVRLNTKFRVKPAPSPEEEEHERRMIEEWRNNR